MGQELIVLLCILPFGIFQHRRDLGIGKPRVGKHYRRIKAVRAEIAMSIDTHFTYHA